MAQANNAPIELERRGLLFVLSSPSGAGKSTLAHMLLESEQQISLSISVTTRPPRPGEEDGIDYHFVDEPTFKKMAKDGEFLEWAHVFGHRYGTPNAPVEQMLANGQDVLFDIDWQGTQQLYQRPAMILSASSSCRRQSQSWKTACANAAQTATK